jgi:hypothetical protein
VTRPGASAAAYKQGSALGDIQSSPLVLGATAVGGHDGRTLTPTGGTRRWQVRDGAWAHEAPHGRVQAGRCGNSRTGVRGQSGDSTCIASPAFGGTCWATSSRAFCDKSPAPPFHEQIDSVAWGWAPPLGASATPSGPTPFIPPRRFDVTGDP